MVSMSYLSAYFHCVFSTKERRPQLTPALRERLWPFLGGIARHNKMKAIEIGGVEDHAHIVQYLKGQEEHHRKRTFKDEFVELLKKHRIIYDERFLWDQIVSRPSGACAIQNSPRR